MPNLFMIDLLGTEVSEEEANILKHPNVAALVLFSRNFTGPEQLKHLIATVRTIRPDIFIAVDHEGGNVQRFQRHGFRSLPAARVYGDVFDLNNEAGIKFAEKYGETMAEDLLGYGIDLGLAPVLDIHSISSVIGNLDRAFHSDPDVVALLATAFIQGMNKAGMPAIGKHFPGHGSVSADSHISKPTLDTPMEILEKKDLKPIVHLINKKLLAAVMPAHVTYTAIDADNPAGFSKIWLQDILRNTLNFQGLVLSDCLGMAGADIGDMSMRANQALEAGCDMLIVCNQSRALLYDVLQTVTFVQTEGSAERIEAFKCQMARFSSEKKDKIIPYLSHTIHATVPTNSVDTPEHEDIK
jgi:beta-N-acetylhexosaminidase